MKPEYPKYETTLRHSPIHRQPFERRNAYVVSFEYRFNCAQINRCENVENSHCFKSALQISCYDFTRLKLT